MHQVARIRILGDILSSLIGKLEEATSGPTIDWNAVDTYKGTYARVLVALKDEDLPPEGQKADPERCRRVAAMRDKFLAIMGKCHAGETADWELFQLAFLEYQFFAETVRQEGTLG